MSRHDSREEIVRVVQIREFVYQGPRAWVRSTLNRALKGATDLRKKKDDPLKVVVSRQVEISDELPPEPVTPDRTIDEHRDRVNSMNGRNQRPKVEQKGESYGDRNSRT